MKGADNLFLDLNNSKLEVKARNLNADGTNIANDSDVGPVDLGLHSLFSSVEMEVCGKTISSQNTLYPHRSFIETRLSFDENVSKTRLLAEEWAEDTSGAYDDFRHANAG